MRTIATLRIFILALSFTATAVAVAGHNITDILTAFPEYSYFNNHLTQTHLADVINIRHPITVLVLHNTIASQYLANQTLSVVNLALSFHILLTYFDPLLPAIGAGTGSMIATTLFRTTRYAAGTTGGFVNITDSVGGKVKFGSVGTETKFDALYVRSVKQIPYNISVLELSWPIIAAIKPRVTVRSLLARVKQIYDTVADDNAILPYLILLCNVCIFFKMLGTLVTLPKFNAMKVVAQKFLGLSNKPRNLKAVEKMNDDPMLVEMINSAIVDRSPSVKWEDIAGLEKAKQALMEMVILPTKRKDLFTGLRKPAKGLLLFGPPGTGKTMLAKAVASESQATFFSISPSSLIPGLGHYTFVGDGEKLVRALFAVANSRQPSVIFIDEIDSVLSARTSHEYGYSRRLKSEFLVQFDGVTSNSNDLVTVIGATNNPQELDDAVLRRLVKRIYIPLPDASSRISLLNHNLKDQQYSLSSEDLEKLVKDTEGYSGSDLQALCEEAAMMPIRDLGSDILTVNAEQVRQLEYGDFQRAMTVIRSSIVKSKWERLEQWNKEFGSN